MNPASREGRAAAPRAARPGPCRNNAESARNRHGHRVLKHGAPARPSVFFGAAAGQSVALECTMHECPLCGESMRLSVRDVQDAKGNGRQVREWICPECDYFEEAESSEG